MNQKIQYPSAYGECPVCNGTGWELYTATVFDYGEPESLTFARKCTKCTGDRIMMRILENLILVHTKWT